MNNLDVLHPFKQYRLDKEHKEVRRLIWILQVKKSMWPNSRERRWFNIKRDKQVVVLKELGYTSDQLFNYAEVYECFWEMFQ